MKKQKFDRTAIKIVLSESLTSLSGATLVGLLSFCFFFIGAGSVQAANTFTSPVLTAGQTVTLNEDASTRTCFYDPTGAQISTLVYNSDNHFVGPQSITTAWSSLISSSLNTSGPYHMVVTGDVFGSCGESTYASALGDAHFIQSVEIDTTSGGGGGGGGGIPAGFPVGSIFGTTTCETYSSTTGCTLWVSSSTGVNAVDNPTLDLFNGILILFMLMFGVIWIFKKR